MLDKNQVLDLYDEGYTCFEIADKFAVPESVIRDILRECIEEGRYHDEEDTNCPSSD